MNKIIALTFLFLCLIPITGHAKPYDIDTNKSHIAFSGTHAGNEFNGEFEKWTAQIDFDENKLDTSTATIILYTGEAKTGNVMYDGTLPTQDWFDTNAYPTIIFIAKQFDKTDTGYAVTGELAVKGITKSITIDFDLSGNDVKTVTAQFPVDRLAYNIGVESDPNAEWVGQIITVDMTLVTTN